MDSSAFFRWTEMDRTTFPALRDLILDYEQEAKGHPEPRSYPGYPRWPLPRTRTRLWPALDRVLRRRRSPARLGTALPSRRKLARLLQLAHGVCAEGSRGPTPSAGGLQGLELYLVNRETAWLPAGLYHYDRAGHHLSQLAAQTAWSEWLELVPSLGRIEGGALLWVLVGDGTRVTAKYAERGLRFLLLEAGHLMQNLCLLSESLGFATVPLGGFFERDLARVLGLLESDVVLYVGVCG
jgi:SagB-type dehydrogenase family enzyme